MKKTFACVFQRLLVLAGTAAVLGSSHLAALADCINGHCR